MLRVLFLVLLLAFSFPVFARVMDFSPAYSPELKKNAEKGEKRSQLELGGVYATGKGVTQDYAEAVKWWRKAAEQGSVEGSWLLGNAYEHGQGVSQDYAEGAKWIQKAASGGEGPQLQLSFLYLKGIGVPQDYSEAYYWHHICDGDRYRPVNFNEMVGHVAITDDEIATHLTREQKLAVDKRVAEYWRRGADEGYQIFQGRLGDLYAKGIGVPQDYAEAYFWLSLSGSGGEAVAEASSHLTPEQKSAVEKRVREWKPKPGKSE